MGGSDGPHLAMGAEERRAPVIPLCTCCAMQE